MNKRMLGFGVGAFVMSAVATVEARNNPKPKMHPDSSNFSAVISLYLAFKAGETNR